MAFRSCGSEKAGWKYPWKWPVRIPALSPCWSTGGCSFLAVCPGCLTAEGKKKEKKNKALPRGSCSSGLAKIRCETSSRFGEWSSWGCRKGGHPQCPCTQGPCLQDPCRDAPRAILPTRKKKVFLKYSLGFLIALMGMGGVGSSAPHCPRSTASSAPGHQHRHPQVTKTLLTPTFVPTAV